MVARQRPAWLWGKNLLKEFPKSKVLEEITAILLLVEDDAQKTAPIMVDAPSERWAWLVRKAPTPRGQRWSIPVSTRRASMLRHGMELILGLEPMSQFGQPPPRAMYQSFKGKG